MDEKRVIGELAGMTIKDLYLIWDAMANGAEHELYFPQVARGMALINSDSSEGSWDWLVNTLDMPLEDIVNG